MDLGSNIRMREATDPTWQRNLAGEDPADTAHRKLAQAEALASCMVGTDLRDPFEDFNDVLRQDVRALLADTITEAREALAKCRFEPKEKQA